MPFYLRDRDIFHEMDGVHSVLILPCGFCPAASLAVREDRPFIDLFHSFLKTPAYEEYIQRMRTLLHDAKIATEVYPSKMPIVCMWPAGLRVDLARQAAEFDAVIVLGCDAAVETVRQCLKRSGCRVISGMAVDGIMNVVPSFHFPFKVSLEASSVIHVLEQSGLVLGEYGEIYHRMEQALEEYCMALQPPAQP